jgi:hypothetical protein
VKGTRMVTSKGLIRFLVFLAISSLVVLLSIRIVKMGREKASHKSEFMTIERLRSRQTDEMSKSTLVKEFNEQRIRQLHERFHHLPVEPEIDTPHLSQCLMCHSLLPHSKNERIRVMMNMHSDFLNCETCHYKKERDTISYAWYDMGIDNEITAGPKFGIGYDPVTGMLEGTDNHISKITPVRAVDGKKEVLFMPQSHPMAEDYLAIKDKLNPGQREVAKKKFHGEIDGKGWACRDCHREKGILSLQDLGFSDKRIQEIEHLEIVGLFDKYEIFHLPQW